MTLLQKQSLLLSVNIFTVMIASEKKPLPPKYDAVKVLRGWVNDPEFSKKIRQEQSGKAIDTTGLTSHKVNAQEQPINENNDSERYAMRSLYMSNLEKQKKRNQDTINGTLFTIGADLQRGGKYIAIPKKEEIVRAKL